MPLKIQSLRQAIDSSVVETSLSRQTRTDSVILLDKDGNVKRVLYEVQQAGRAVNGLAWIQETQEIAVSVDVQDAIMAINSYNGSVRQLYASNQLNGAIRGLAQLGSGNMVAIESNNFESFTLEGDRVNNGIFPKVTGNSNTAQLNSLQNGGLVGCSYNR